MLEAIIVGIIQGIAEWLPVSSEGVIFLIKTKFFEIKEADLIVKEILFLHLGTFLAALVYFRKEVWSLTKALFNFKKAEQVDKKVIIFLTISTLISGLLGLVLIEGFKQVDLNDGAVFKAVTLIVGAMLLITAFLQLKATTKGQKDYRHIKKRDGLLLGLVQGLAALPGLSRSGLTVSALLLSRFDKTVSLKLSFLMSLPIVLGGNLVLNLDQSNLSLENLVGFLAAFLGGLLTIDLLLKLARKINFGYFVLFFAFLTIVSVFI